MYTIGILQKKGLCRACSGFEDRDAALATELMEKHMDGILAAVEQQIKEMEAAEK